MRRVAAHYLLSPDGLLPGGVVTVDEAGVIRDISFPGHLDREAGVEFYPGILVPGMVNAHCHLELSHLRGAIPPGGGFAAFVEGMKAARQESGELKVESGKLANAKSISHNSLSRSPLSTFNSQLSTFRDAKMWAEGVSAVGDICNGADTFELKRTSRIRYHNFIEIFGAGADPARAFALRDEAEAMGLTATVTPHSLYSLSRENYQLSIINYPLSIHFMESDFELPSSAERLIAQTPPDRAVLLVHNCLVTRRDIDIVMGHFTAPVTWVLCPGSNRYISGLKPPVGLLRGNGLQIAVGTDSLASNETLSMVRELSLLGDVPLEESLRWATINGARALGMDDTLGSIEVGKSPGLVVLSGINFKKMALTENSRTERII